MVELEEEREESATLKNLELGKGGMYVQLSKK